AAFYFLKYTFRNWKQRREGYLSHLEVRCQAQLRFQYANHQPLIRNSAFDQEKVTQGNRFSNQDDTSPR
ncbi:MAG TPA: hypothetical protein VF493_00800, partial [Terriglobales bacterium]